MVKQAATLSYDIARKIVISLAGVSVLALGIAMVILPGPAILVIPLGLGILAVEFAWARRWLEQLREGSDRVLARFLSSRT